MKKIAIAFAAAATLALASCSTIEPVCATSNPVGKKVGEATGKFLFGSLPMGNCDYSIATAAKNGGIKQISTVDLKAGSSGIFTTLTTIVTGE